MEFRRRDIYIIIKVIREGYSVTTQVKLVSSRWDKIMEKFSELTKDSRYRKFSDMKALREGPLAIKRGEESLIAYASLGSMMGKNYTQVEIHRCVSSNSIRIESQDLKAEDVL